MFNTMEYTVPADAVSGDVIKIMSWDSMVSAKPNPNDVKVFTVTE